MGYPGEADPLNEVSMPRNSLGPVEGHVMYLLLGRGSATAQELYETLAAAGQRITSSNLYFALERLEQRKQFVAHSPIPEDAKGRFLYRLTDRGKEVARESLTVQLNVIDQIRDVAARLRG